MTQPRHIQDLADELLSEISSFLLEEPALRYLNGNAGRNRPDGYHAGEYEDHRSVYGEASELDRFRLVCKRFMRIGTPRKFSRFNLRFSENGFRRLDDLLNMQLACYVKTVTYLVRPFYQGSDWVPVLRTLGTEDPILAQLHSRRLREQTTLVSTNYDLTQLRAAIAAFSALQEIKLLRLQDEADEQLLDFVRDQAIGHATSDTHFDWESACSRAVTNLGIALLDSQRTSIRFIGPQISPEATLQLLEAPSTTLAAMGGRLTSLDINFHAHVDITATMSDLSPVFHRFFTEAKNLVAIHIGFPAKTPLDLNLETIFHGIRWKTLRTLSLQGWRLGADDIITLARRHRHQLREFRLYAVYLRDGGRWSDVLCMLRTEMERLSRLDLREIDYATNFDALAIDSGVEIFDPQPAGPISSSVSVAAGTSSREGPLLPTFGTNGHHPGLIPGGKLSRRRSLEKVRGLAAEELGDDGIRVHRDQVHLWEAWVLSGLRGDMKNGKLHFRP
ncbi:F-box domain protein [Penicillium brasilianum]|uniref:F-box domain protein n=1 Tax=Penicillium brasilianum TaxID=104259 RepID=A0A1S9RHR6_PENBI|nr:F-box domain protein [Penicillium brasilianum]